MLVDTKEKLESALESIPLISNIEWIYKEKGGWSRKIQFTVRNRTYKIVWFTNVSTLYINDEIAIPFDSLAYNGFYPNDFKNNLIFSLNGNSVLYMPVEEYKASTN